MDRFGRSTGGVVNVITKSGTNLWHGTGFYYLRHREFAPRTVFGDDTAPTRQQFGGTVGGPLNRDKSFFFMAYDQQAQHDALEAAFSATADAPGVKGFAVGRTIFMDAAERWLAGAISDEAAIEDMATRFEKLTEAWLAARSRKAA